MRFTSFSASYGLVKSNIMDTVPGMIAGKDAPVARPSSPQTSATADGEAPN